MQSSMLERSSAQLRTIDDNTTIRSFDAHWRALSNGTNERPRQALPNRVAMINWQFAGLKSGRLWPAAVKNDAIFQRRHRWNHDDKGYRLAVYMTINNFDEIWERQSRYARQYCDNDDDEDNDDSFATLNDII